MCESNSPADTKVSAEGGGGDAPGVEIPLQLIVKAMVKKAGPLQSIEVHGGPAAPGRELCCSRWMLKVGCDPMGSPGVNRGMSSMEATLEQGKSPPPEKGEVAETTSNELTKAYTSIPLSHWMGGR
ncbi:hypothetical protein BTVI_144291 [Pitangus sulphuratus]|nr:hypothetical protein BTVI_144291 [Pitangus sulphuratus]